MEAIDFDKLRAIWVVEKEKRIREERRIAYEEAEKIVEQSVNEYSNMLRRGVNNPVIMENLGDVSYEDARAIVDRIILANPTLKNTIFVRYPHGLAPIVIVENPK